MGKPKSPKPVSWAASQARRALGKNLLRQIEKKWAGSSPTAGFLAIGKSTGLSLSTLQRMVKGDVAPTIDTIANIAYALGCEVSDLTATFKDGLTEKPVEPPAPPIRQGLRRAQRKK